MTLYAFGWQRSAKMPFALCLPYPRYRPIGWDRGHGKPGASERAWHRPAVASDRLEIAVILPVLKPIMLVLFGQTRRYGTPDPVEKDRRVLRQASS